jgi:hypothetical protein
LACSSVSIRDRVFDFLRFVRRWEPPRFLLLLCLQLLLQGRPDHTIFVGSGMSQVTVRALPAGGQLSNRAPLVVMVVGAVYTNNPWGSASVLDGSKLQASDTLDNFATGVIVYRSVRRGCPRRNIRRLSSSRLASSELRNATTREDFFFVWGMPVAHPAYRMVAVGIASWLQSRISLFSRSPSAAVGHAGRNSVGVLCASIAYW